MKTDDGYVDPRWKLTALGIIALLCILSTVLPGNGVQARLDLSKGVGSESFNVSLSAAANLISDQQKSILIWASNRPTRKDYDEIYGRHPTVRKFVMGEILRAADTYRDEIRVLQAEIDGMNPGLVKASQDAILTAQKIRTEALKATDAYAPKIVGVDEERFAHLTYAVVRYKLQLPNEWEVRFLPCTIEYSNKSLTLKGKLDFDCLFMPATDDEYRARIWLPEDFDIKGLQLKMSADFGRAVTSKGGERFPMFAPIKEAIPELTSLHNAQNKMKYVLDKKVYF